MDLKSRLRDYKLWVSVAALIPLLAQAFGYKLDMGKYQELVNAILAVAVAAGLIYRPGGDEQ